jgi:predicted RNA binding protein YcfA (HicA-like mRNA interferase family)
MTQIAKLLFKILRGLSDADIRFEELRNLLLRLGFAERVRGSHHIFRKQGIEEKINLQQDGDKAKPYQVKQVRKILVRYKLGGKL